MRFLFPFRVAGPRHALILFLCFFGTGIAYGQDQNPPPRWGRHPIILPDVGGQLGAGLWLGAAYENPAAHGPYPHLGQVSLYGTIGTTGSRTATLALSAPGLVDGWRLLFLVRTERLLRTPFFGFTNEIRQQDSLADAYGNLFYRYAMLRSTGYVVLQRRLAGPVWLLVGGQARTWRTSGLRQQPSLYVSTATAATGGDTLRFSALEGRAGLLLDTRDDWVVPTRGLLLEAVGASGRLNRNDLGVRPDYLRGMIGAREFVTLGEKRRTVLALRQRVSLARDSLPFFLAWERVTSWMPDDGIAAGRSLRLHGGGSQLASNDALGSVEIRRKLKVPQYDPKDPAALWGILFADGGLLWEHDGGVKRGVWSVGTGVRLQMNRTSLVGLDAGITDLGLNVTVLSYFAF